ncbi:MAG: pilus (MSHA type) biogenesis protein MshL [Cellvibrionaceae bacterium]
MMIKKLLTFSVLVALAGCASHSQDKPMVSETVMGGLAQEALIAQASPPEAVSSALLSGGSFDDQPVAEVDARFDVSVNRVPAREFFLSLVEGTGINVVVHPDVSGKITLDLKNVTIKDVLALTQDIYGYAFKETNGIYTVHPSDIRSEIFYINYLDVKRKGISNSSVVVGRITGSSSSNDNNSSNSKNNSSNSNQEGGKANGAAIQTITEADFWKDLKATLDVMVGSEKDGRKVIVSPQAGMVVIKAMPNELASVREFLERSELSVQRQVILETKILEVQLREGFEAGINWGQLVGSAAWQMDVAPPEGTGLNLDYASEVFSSVIGVADITQLLGLLETQGDVQVLSSPRISTVNNQKALIRVGADEFFVTGISTNTTSNASSTTTTPEVEITSFFSGIALDVTPQISENDEVILHIHPVVSDVTDQQKEFTIGGESFSLPLALRDIRESDSIVRARNGQVVVLGGLMQENSSNTGGERPGLGKVPLLGSLFKTRNRTSLKSELVILMRPIIVNEKSTRRYIEDSNSRFNKLGDYLRNGFSDN